MRKLFLILSMLLFLAAPAWADIVLLDKVVVGLSDCSVITTPGMLCRDTDDNVVYIGTGSSAVAIGAALGSSSIITTGTISGGTYSVSTGSSCTIGTDCDGTSTKVAYGGIVYVTGAATVTLPAVQTGMSICVHTWSAVAVSVDANASDRIRLDGTALDDGDKVTNASTSGDFICLHADSANGWTTFGRSGTWTDGG